jgi:hypothetical protein
LYVSGLFGSSAFHFPDAFLHLLTGLESDYELLWHKDFIAGSGVACLAGCPPLDLKYAEIPQLNSMVFHQSLDDGIERLLDDLFRLELGEPDLLGDRFNNLFFCHLQFPYENGHECESPTPVAALLMPQV